MMIKITVLCLFRSGITGAQSVPDSSLKAGSKTGVLPYSDLANRGNEFYREGKYENAILEYQTVIEKYPKGNKIPDALLKQGLSFYIIGDKASSRLILQELINKYPGTSQAQSAKKKLANF